MLGGAALAPVALVALVEFAPCADAVIAHASLIFLRTFDIPKAPSPRNKVPAPASFTNSRLEICLSFKLS
ncbi:MAG: hypothetical protein M3224_02460 [Thermoproteota archaeon]|nr:hypothetical protein [Thermoproteota archaeon]MDQ4022573.1 hypothetical protein [Thermoproteota archaeon]